MCIINQTISGEESEPFFQYLLLIPTSHDINMLTNMNIQDDFLESFYPLMTDCLGLITPKFLKSDLKIKKEELFFNSSEEEF
jgi:hypothetical protein